MWKLTVRVLKHRLLVTEDEHNKHLLKAVDCIGRQPSQLTEESA